MSDENIGLLVFLLKKIVCYNYEFSPKAEAPEVPSSKLKLEAFAEFL